MIASLRRVAVLLAVGISSTGACLSAFGEESEEASRPLAPAAALASMSVPAGFKVELVAAEPLVFDPVAFDWGRDGELWVVEMADYPHGDGGRVVRLTDSDGDGAFDHRDVFLDGLPCANGVMAWREGVLVSAAPEIFYAEDTDGDGRCDSRKALFTGFSRANPQHLMNGFVWGLDNWVHAGGEESFLPITIGESDQTLMVRGDFRFDPDGLSIERESGRTQFGRARNDAGDWFGTTNSDPGFHVVLEDRYLERNPHLRAPHVERQISESPGASQVFPTSRTGARFNDLNKANRFTSACGLCVYRDDWLGASFYGDSFVCEPVHNLVHREILTEQGVTWSSRRPDDERDREFLSSSDPWFRPASAKTGPDGALWVADMYRETIEHPEWIPDEWESRLDLFAGSDRGRIYRVVRDDRPRRAIPRTKGATTDELVEVLRSPNGAARDMAHRELIWRGDAGAVPSLERVVRDGERPACRIQALSALNGLGAASEEVLIEAFQDRDADVRRQAVRIAEPRLEESEALLSAVKSLASDPSVRVQMQVAFSLGDGPANTSGAELAAIAKHDGGDPYVRAAIFSSATRDLAAFAGGVAASSNDLPIEALSETIYLAVANGDDASVAKLFAALHQTDRQVAGLLALQEGLKHRSLTLAAYREQATGELAEALKSIDDLVRDARATLDDDAAPPDDRAAALRLLVATGENLKVEKLIPLLEPNVPSSLQDAAFDALPVGPQTQKALLTRMETFGPRLRSAALDWLIAKTNSRAALLDAVESKALAASLIDAARRQALLADGDEAIRDRAAALLGGPSDAERGAIVERYRDAVTLTGDVARGQALFVKHCATCHRLQEQGHAVGPDLAALSDRSPQALLVATLDPNRAVETKYLGYTVLDSDGRLHQGLLVAESGAGVELLAGDGKRTSLLRSEIENLKSSGQSLMPVGFERDLSPQDLADVFALLRETRPVRKTVAGNEPRVVSPEGLRGEFWLLPRDAELYGPTLAFDDGRQDLSDWRSLPDAAAWTIAVEREGDYRLSVEIARTGESKSSSLSLEVAGERMEVELPATGSEDVFSEVGFSTVRLSSGERRVVVRPSEAIPEGDTFRLRSVRLLPQ